MDACAESSRREAVELLEAANASATICCTLTTELAKEALTRALQSAADSPPTSETLREQFCEASVGADMTRLNCTTEVGVDEAEGEGIPARTRMRLVSHTSPFTVAALRSELVYTGTRAPSPKTLAMSTDVTFAACTTPQKTDPRRRSAIVELPRMTAALKPVTLT